uniref:Leucine-rich repeat-containing N-terminal plant-type domain-containing protein n=1 Tax=Solanum lycopersicum TaxID=4081 RepID=A0A3Q7EXR7_SOLLC
MFLDFLYLFTVTFASTEEAITILKWKATFKNQINSLLASWTQSSNTCGDWYGVMCLMVGCSEEHLVEYS